MNNIICSCEGKILYFTRHNECIATSGVHNNPPSEWVFITFFRNKYIETYSKPFDSTGIRCTGV